MNTSYMTVLTVSEITNSTAVAMVMGDRILGSFAPLVPLGVAISTFGCAMAIQFSVTRQVSWDKPAALMFIILQDLLCFCSRRTHARKLIVSTRDTLTSISIGSFAGKLQQVFGQLNEALVGFDRTLRTLHRRDHRTSRVCQFLAVGFLRLCHGFHADFEENQERRP